MFLRGTLDNERGCLNQKSKEPMKPSYFILPENMQITPLKASSPSLFSDPKAWMAYILNFMSWYPQYFPSSPVCTKRLRYQGDGWPKALSFFRLKCFHKSLRQSYFEALLKPSRVFQAFAAWKSWDLQLVSFKNEHGLSTVRLHFSGRFHFDNCHTY